MFEFLKRKYNEPDSKVTDVELNIAVERGWITQEQMNEIKSN